MCPNFGKNKESDKEKFEIFTDYRDKFSTRKKYEPRKTLKDTAEGSTFSKNGKSETVRIHRIFNAIFEQVRRNARLTNSRLKVLDIHKFPDNRKLIKFQRFNDRRGLKELRNKNF